MHSPTSETFFKPFVEQAIETVYGLVERHGIRVRLRQSRHHGSCLVEMASRLLSSRGGFPRAHISSLCLRTTSAVRVKLSFWPTILRASTDKLDFAFNFLSDIALDNRSKAVAMGALRLIAGGNGSMTVKRKKRPWHMWLTNFGKGVKELFT